MRICRIIPSHCCSFQYEWPGRKFAPAITTVHFADLPARSLFAAAVMTSLLARILWQSASFVPLGSPKLFVFVISIFARVKNGLKKTPLSAPLGRTFYETTDSRYNHPYAVRCACFACLGSSSRSGMVRFALWHSDRAAGAGLAADSRRSHDSYLSAKGIWQN